MHVSMCLGFVSSLNCDVQLCPPGRHRRNFCGFAGKYVTVYFTLLLSFAADLAVGYSVHV